MLTASDFRALCFPLVTWTCALLLHQAVVKTLTCENAEQNTVLGIEQGALERFFG